MSIDQIETEMKAKAANFAGLGAKVRFDFGDQGSLFLDAKSGMPKVSRDAGEADTTLKISLDDFVKLSRGDLNPTWAFTTGKLKVQGNMGVALKLAGMMED
ncbi:MAG TPA: SCP2 sterol-binding domain-containing protein [Azospirillaceae bacterium]|jgi:putative sterol carrier protein|nr:SCP2 sterol-binding domain-containing protein [Azospirillaceae bacterium]